MSDRRIIDGYNVLHAHPVYGSMAAADMDAARSRLVADLAGYAQGGPRVVVVFDGAGNPASNGAPHHIGWLTVIFSPTGVSADTVVEGLARRSRDRGERAVVVTSDGATRQTVRSGTISVLSSEEFVAEMLASATEQTEAGRGSGKRVPLSRRVAPDVGDTLARWARGSGPDRRSPAR